MPRACPVFPGRSVRRLLLGTAIASALAVGVVAPSAAASTSSRRTSAARDWLAPPHRQFRQSRLRWRHAYRRLTRAERWRWQNAERADLREAGARIPLVIGAIKESAQPMAVGWAVPYKNWYLTPTGSAALGRFLAPFIAGFRHVFDVTVNWSEGGEE